MVRNSAGGDNVINFLKRKEENGVYKERKKISGEIAEIIDFGEINAEKECEYIAQGIKRNYEILMEFYKNFPKDFLNCIRYLKRKKILGQSFSSLLNSCNIDDLSNINILITYIEHEIDLENSLAEFDVTKLSKSPSSKVLLERLRKNSTSEEFFAIIKYLNENGILEDKLRVLYKISETKNSKRFKRYLLFRLIFQRSIKYGLYG